MKSTKEATTCMSSSCQFWLTGNAGSDRMLIPVLPDRVDVGHGSQNQSVSVAGLGEITIIQDRNAITYKWSSHFPARYHQGCSTTALWNPLAYCSKIEEWIASTKPVKFIATGCGINCYCSIEQFDYYEKGGDPDTLYYTISLKEYRAVFIRQLDTTPMIETPVPQANDSSDDSGGASTKTDETRQGKVKTQGGRLHLRADASTSSQILDKMPNGSTMTVLGQKGDWYKVEYGGVQGWAYKDYVKLTN